MKQAITGFRVDEVGDWVAELACRHLQHVRHHPPWIVREWVTSESGRQSNLGTHLECKKCDQRMPADY